VLSRVVRVLVVSDTHIPDRARDLPALLWAEVERADLVIHAGDWVGEEFADRLAARAARLIGVAGNNDGAGLAARHPQVARTCLDGLRVAVVHETGPARGREARLDARFPDTDLLVFGHSHIPWDSRTPNGLRLVNPGSPTDRRRQPVGTFITFRVQGGRLSAVRLHPVSIEGS
jgi:putative phosphoesterase